ncbi:hypothetical protein EG329_003379 [Mollisiaceae sp. DMI_Dod_QoI]|nr:hypothetical protein EG329_003379 [Helotiales sp. DMI_Dod_QoI]
MYPPYRRQHGNCNHLPISSGFRVGCHSGQDLVNFVKANSQRRNYMLSQRGTQLCNALALGKRPTEVILGQLGKNFDDLFFGGQLLGHCLLHFTPVPSSRSGFNARTTETSPGSAEILIYTRDDKDEVLAQTLRGYISTLLREMAHAFLVVYQCRFCFHADATGDPQAPGHGQPFDEIIRVVEIACRDPRYIDLPLDLKHAA